VLWCDANVRHSVLVVVRVSTVVVPEGQYMKPFQVAQAALEDLRDKAKEVVDGVQNPFDTAMGGDRSGSDDEDARYIALCSHMLTRAAFTRVACWVGVCSMSGNDDGDRSRPGSVRSRLSRLVWLPCSICAM
jgi:hypothetical protein